MGRERTGKVEEGRERGMMTGEREEEREVFIVFLFDFF